MSSSSISSSTKCVHPRLMDGSPFTVLVLPIMALHAIYFLSPVLALFVIFTIYFHRTSAFWISVLESHLETGNVQVSISPSGNHTQIEIGGQQHSNNWKEDLQLLFIKPLKTECLRYNSKRFKLNIVVHSQVSSSAKEFRHLMDMLSVRQGALSSSFGSRTPPLELNVEVVQDDNVNIEHSLEFSRLINLQKLTWKGSSPSFLLDGLDGGADCQDQDVLFPRLTELCLIDCGLSAADLAKVLTQCPALISLEVHQLRYISEEVNCIDLNDLSSSPSTYSIFTHPTLQNLRVASSLDLRPFFHGVRLPSIRSVSLHVSRFTPMERPIHEHISLLNIPWSSMSYFELIAPLNYYSVRYLKSFFDREPALYSRTHSLSMDSL